MNIEDVRTKCLAKPHATEDMPFGDDFVAFRVGGKIFGGLPLEKPNLIVMKCTPELFDDLTAQYEAIEQARHWGKRQMVQIHLDGDNINDDVINSIIDHAYNLVYGKLTKKLRAELEQQSEKMR